MKTYENPIHTRPRDPPIHPALPRRTREIMERIYERIDRFMERDMYTRRRLPTDVQLCDINRDHPGANAHLNRRGVISFEYNEYGCLTGERHEHLIDLVRIFDALNSQQRSVFR